VRRVFAADLLQVQRKVIIHSTYGVGAGQPCRGPLAIVVALALVGRVAAHAEEPPSFVGAPACVGCHTAEFDAWRGSHNALAMQPASAATVLGDFARAQFEHFGSRLPSFVTARNS
jgi:hypothetical protein